MDASRKCVASPAARSRSRRRTLELAGVCLAAALLVWLLLSRLPSFVLLTLSTQDKLVDLSRPRLDAKEFVFVAVDDASMKLDQLWPEDIAASPTLQVMAHPDNWPWPRSVWADAIDKIISAGAKVVMLDLIFDKPRSGDTELERALDAHPRQVVIGVNFIKDTQSPDHQSLYSLVPNMPSPSLIKDPWHDPRVGFVNFWPTPQDQVVREAIYGIDRLDRHLDSFGAAALRLAGYGDRVPAGMKQLPFHFVKTSSIRTVSFFSLFVASDWKHALQDGAIFKNKIVVIGPSATILHDEQVIPAPSFFVSRITVPGALLHINAMAAAIHRSFYAPAGPLATFAAIFGAAAVALAITAGLMRRPMWALGTLVSICAFYFGICVLVLGTLNYALPFASPVLALLISGGACISWNFTRERLESGRMRSMLERYVSRNVVREVLDNRDDFLTKLGGTRQPVTVLFSDVRGFTSFSEHADASAVVEQLNEYLGEMVGIIFRNHGTVDKFIGDGIMAVWGNVVSEGEDKDALRAVTAAVEMLARLASLNEEWTAKGIHPFQVGIGVHHGDAVFGNIGSSEKMEPTVIGDTVNLASRVEGLTKRYGLSLCVTRPVADHAREYFRFRSVDLVRAVGKSRPVEILTVVGHRDEEPREWLDHYESAVADFRAQKFAEAAAILRQCLEQEPTDGLCAMYLRRAETFLAEPPPADWDGAEIATSK
jgi:adenylate cyclase